jgi:integrase/recombinase XerD
MVRRTTRRGKRVLVIDFSYTKPDGTEGRYRRDAAVQTAAAAQTEAAARKLGATLFGNPEIMCGPNGVPLRPAEAEPVPEPTFRAVFERYLSEYAPSAMSPSTLDGYRSKLHTHVVPRLGELPLPEAFEVARSREIDVALVEGAASISTRRNVLLGLRSVARFAVEAKLLAVEPKYLPLPKRGKRVPSAPRAEDVAALIDAASCPEHRLVFLLAAHAGLRKGEIRALRCMDVELEHHRLVVRLSRYRHDTRSPKSGNERQVPLSPQLREALIEARVHQRPREEAAALNTRGKPWGTDGTYAALQRTLRRLKLPRARLHALRAFFVTILLSGNVPVHVVRELVGHEDLATTQGYAAILAPDRGAAVGVLDRVHQGARQEQDRRRADKPERVRPMQRTGHATRRIRLLRKRVLGRLRSRGNNSETRRPLPRGCGSLLAGARQRPSCFATSPRRFGAQRFRFHGLERASY